MWFLLRISHLVNVKLIATWLQHAKEQNREFQGWKFYGFHRLFHNGSTCSYSYEALDSEAVPQISREAWWKLTIFTDWLMAQCYLQFSVENNDVEIVWAILFSLWKEEHCALEYLWWGVRSYISLKNCSLLICFKKKSQKTSLLSFFPS